MQILQHRVPLLDDIYEQIALTVLGTVVTLLAASLFSIAFRVKKQERLKNRAWYDRRIILCKQL